MKKILAFAAAVLAVTALALAQTQTNIVSPILVTPPPVLSFPQLSFPTNDAKVIGIQLLSITNAAGQSVFPLNVMTNVFCRPTTVLNVFFYNLSPGNPYGLTNIVIYANIQ
jgi:hypothetical protein